MDQYALNWYSEFCDKKIEDEYRESEKTTSLKTVRVLVLLLGSLFTLFIFSDFIFYRDVDSLFAIASLRVLVLLAVLFAFYLTGRIKKYCNVLLMITIVQVFIFAVFLLISVLNRGREPAIQLASILLLIVAMFSIPNLWKNSLIASIIIMVSYMIFGRAFIQSSPYLTMARQGLYLGVGLIFCAVCIYGRERSQRRHYSAEKQMELMIITDKLTGIYNRGRFEYILDRWIKNRRHNPFCLVLFDIDNFKRVNDQFGHGVGDQVLIAVSNVINSSIRDTDIFARWGGEEFVILFSNVHIDMAMILAERLRIAVENYNFDKVGRVTISLGVAEHRAEESIIDFVERADGKMYEAKRAGRNKVMGDLNNPPEGYPSDYV